MGSQVEALREQARARCLADPSAAIATTGAETSPTDLSDPLHNDVRITAHPGIVIPTGLHPALGGDGQSPCPGDLLMAALTACMESTLRHLADDMGVPLRRLQVTATSRGDLSPMLKLPPAPQGAPLGVRLVVDLEAEPGTPPEMVEALLGRADARSPILQMLRGGVEVTTDLRSYPAGGVA